MEYVSSAAKWPKQFLPALQRLRQSQAQKSVKSAYGMKWWKGWNVMCPAIIWLAHEQIAKTRPPFLDHHIGPSRVKRRQLTQHEPPSRCCHVIPFR